VFGVKGLMHQDFAVALPTTNHLLIVGVILLRYKTGEGENSSIPPPFPKINFPVFFFTFFYLQTGLPLF